MDQRKRFGLFAGPILFLILFALPNPSDLSLAGWHTVAIVALMATWWITEAIPIAATALIPVVAFPVLEIGTVREATSPFAEPIIFLFLGGFLIALALQKWGLHRVLALYVISKFGTGRTALVAGFMLSAALLSMWISNTATALMLLPVALSIVSLNETDIYRQDDNFSTALLLGLAYGCNIGGMATLIGTPPNAFLAGFMEQEYGYIIAFVDWLMIGVPLVVVSLPVAFIILTVTLPLDNEAADLIGKSKIEAELEKRGKLGREQIVVAIVFAMTIVLWVTRPFLAAYVPGISDAGIAMFGGLLLFAIPADFKNNTFLLDWKTARTLPWGTLILFGGGLSLAAAFTRTGLSQWFGEMLAGVGALHILIVILLVSTVVIFLTEITSNTATAATLLPVVAALAVGLGQHPMLLAVPVVFSASCAFMLPVATPPNAIVYASEHISMPQMARIGFILNLVFIALISLMSYYIVSWFFGLPN